MKPVAQEQSMGCGVACVASKFDISYKKALNLFDNKQNSVDAGYMMNDLANAMLKKRKSTFKIIKAKNNMRTTIGDIVFISWPEPHGHYLLKTKQGWMNSWINHPNITPAKAGYQKKIKGKILWILREI